MAFTQPDAWSVEFDFSEMVKSGRLDELLPAYTRTGTVYVQGPDGLLVPCLTDRPLKGYMATTPFEPIGLLFNSAALTNDCLHGRDMTQAAWTMPGPSSEITIARCNGADGVAASGSQLTFNGPGAAALSITNAVSGPGGVIRCTSVAHGQVTGRTGTVVIASVHPTAAVRTMSVVDADTFDLLGTTFVGTFSAPGSFTFVPAIFQSITDATSRARCLEFAAKYDYLSDIGVYRWTIDGGAHWNSFAGVTPRHLWENFGGGFHSSIGTANQKNPKVGFCSETVGARLQLDMIQCVQNISMPLGVYFPAAGSPVTLGVSTGEITSAGKLITKTGAAMIEWYYKAGTRDRMASNYTPLEPFRAQVDSNNYVKLITETPAAAAENRYMARYATAGVLQADLSVQGKIVAGVPEPGLQPNRIDPILVTWGANDVRVYGWVDGSRYTSGNLIASDSSVSTWGSELSGALKMGDFCYVRRVRLLQSAQIAT